MSAVRGLLMLALSAGFVPAQGTAQVGTWEPFEVSLAAGRELANAYVAGLPDGQPAHVRVTFTGATGEAAGRKYTVAGFWDGGISWKARFAPPAAGEWNWVSESPDPALNGVRGRLRAAGWSEGEKAANASRRGPVRVTQSGPHAGHYFECADGTPFLWIGDTWWNWSKRGIRLETFQKLADDRARKGFSVGQLFFPGNGGLLDRSFTQPDLEQIRKVEEFIRYANSKGIAVWIHPWWSRKGLNETAGEENVRRWWRYTIHRLGAYDVIWVLAGEYNMNAYGGFGLEFWKRLGAMVRAEDPYRRVIGAHPTPPGWEGGADAPQWSTGEVLHSEPWLDYNQSQVGHGKWRNEMIPRVVTADYRRTPAKPVVVTEPWYEFIRDNPPAADIRFGAWSAVLSGAAGHTYGGGHVWWAHVPEAPTQQGSWPLQISFDTDTLDYPGAVGMSVMAGFLRSIRWWELEPHPETGFRFARAVLRRSAGAGVRRVSALRRIGEGGPAAIRRGGQIRVCLARPQRESRGQARRSRRRRGAALFASGRLSALGPSRRTGCCTLGASHSGILATRPCEAAQLVAPPTDRSPRYPDGSGAGSRRSAHPDPGSDVVRQRSATGIATAAAAPRALVSRISSDMKQPAISPLWAPESKASQWASG